MGWQKEAPFGGRLKNSMDMDGACGLLHMHVIHGAEDCQSSYY